MPNVVRRGVGRPRIDALNPAGRDTTAVATGPAKKTRLEQIQERLQRAQTREDLLRAKVVEYAEEHLINPIINPISSSILHIAMKSRSYANTGAQIVGVGGIIAMGLGYKGPNAAKRMFAHEEGLQDVDLRLPGVALPAGAALGATLGVVKGVYDVASGKTRQSNLSKKVEKETGAVVSRLMREFDDVHYDELERLVTGYLVVANQKKLGFPLIREELLILNKFSRHGNRQTRKIAEEMVDLATVSRKSTSEVNAKRGKIQDLLERYGRGWKENDKGEMIEGKPHLKEGDYLIMQQTLSKLYEVAMDLKGLPAPLED